MNNGNYRLHVDVDKWFYEKSAADNLVQKSSFSYRLFSTLDVRVSIEYMTQNTRRTYTISLKIIRSISIYC